MDRFGLTPAWHWLAANRFSVLVAICLATIFCGILLSFYMHRQARQLRQLRQDAKQTSVLLDELAKSVAALTAAQERGETSPPQAAAAPERLEAPPPVPEAARPEVDLAAMRSEIKLMLADMGLEAAADGARAEPSETQPE